jgi:hypothetical protein
MDQDLDFQSGLGDSIESRYIPDSGYVTEILPVVATCQRCGSKSIYGSGYRNKFMTVAVVPIGDIFLPRTQ